MKIIIVGGVAGGATAAARLRRISEDYQIIVMEKDEYISYANCGLPYYIGGVISDRRKLQVQTVKSMAHRFNLDIRVKHEVISIDKRNKKVTVKSLIDGATYEESYDKLILSCGAKPIIPDLPGYNPGFVFTLRNIPDTYRIKDYIDNNGVNKAVVIGGGFIGVEMAENLRELGIMVTLVEKMNQVLRPLDFEMAQIIHGELESNGINLILGDGISAFEGKNVKLESGKVIESDMTILAIGVTPENSLARQANLASGERGHLKVTEDFRVYSGENPEKDIYAVGDMIEVINPLDDTPYFVPLAWGANRQGRLVADSVSGMKIKKSRILGANVIKVFGLTAASVGANENMLKQKGIKYHAIHSHRANHASYYPDWSTLTIKLLFCPETGRIFGAQAVGKEGTEKRIDIIAAVMRLNGTAYDLSDIEICYAPPYSSAKDPVNILGYIAENVMNKVFKLARHDEMESIVENGGVLLDVRTPQEFLNGHIKGSINIELDSLRENIDKIPAGKDDPIYVTCQVGLRAYLAINILRSHGFTNLYNLTGGYTTYRYHAYKAGIKNAAPESGINGSDKEGKCKVSPCTGFTV